MSGPTQNAAPQIEGLQEALDAARAQGHAAGQTEGYAAGRRDAAAIMGAEAAAGCAEFAAELAGDPSISVERAASLIARVPKAAAKEPSIASLLAARSPDVGPANPPEQDARASRVAHLQSIGKMVKG